MTTQKAVRAARNSSARKLASASKSLKKAAARTADDADGVLNSIAAKLDDARAELVKLPAESAAAARKTLDKAALASRRTVKKLNSKWAKMEPAHRVGVVTAILAAIAAAVVIPLATKSRKKGWLG